MHNFTHKQRLYFVASTAATMYVFYLLIWSPVPRIDTLVTTTKIETEYNGQPSSGEDVLAQVDLNTEFSTTIIDTSPRVVIASPCSGSSVVMKFTAQILRAHGIDIDLEPEPVRLKKDNIMDKARHRLKNKMDREPTLDETVAESIVFLNERALKNGKILLFKVHIISDGVMEALKGLNAKFAYTYRDNLFDRAICASKDCFAEGMLGHPVFINGTQSDACFDRRQMDEKVMPFFNNTESLITKMHEWDKVVERKKKDYMPLHYPAQAAAYEEMFKFEYTDQEDTFNHSIQVWCDFLKNFADVEAQIVERVLRKYMNSRKTRNRYNEMVYNFEEVAKAIEASPFRDSLLEY